MQWMIPALCVRPQAAATMVDASGSGAVYDHAAVRDVIIDAMNGDYLSSAPSKYLALFPDDDAAAATWCDPYPACYNGKQNISTFLNSMPKGTDSALLPDPLVTVGRHVNAPRRPLNGGRTMQSALHGVHFTRGAPQGRSRILFILTYAHC